MESRYIQYLNELGNTDWVAEIIAERFDNILDLLTPNSFVYGGAVRDCLSGKELEGDIDIAVPQSEHRIITTAFSTNPRWVSLEKRDGAGLGNYRWMQDSPMSSVTNFKSATGQIAQIIASKSRSMNSIEDTLYIARMVDIRCCGVVMLANGKVYEVVPNAFNDCRDGVLNINELSETKDISVLPDRVGKLVKRGWINNIDVDKIMREAKNNERKSDKRKSKEHIDFKKVRDNASIGLRMTDNSLFVEHQLIDRFFQGSSRTLFEYLKTLTKAMGLHRSLEITTSYRRKGFTIRDRDPKVIEGLYYIISSELEKRRGYEGVELEFQKEEVVPSLNSKLDYQVYTFGQEEPETSYTKWKTVKTSVNKTTEIYKKQFKFSDILKSSG